MLDALAAAAKAVLYAGVLSCAGAVFAVATLQGSKRLEAYATQVMRRGAYVTIAVALLSSVVLFFQLGGQYDEPTVLAVFASSRGAALCLQLAGALLLLANPADPGASGTTGTQISNAALLTASLAISGHAITAGLLNAIVVLAHVVAAAWWIGSLLLLRNAWVHETSLEFADVVRRFSVWAMRFIVALVVAGALLIVTLVDFSAERLLTPYAGLLLLKLVVAATVLTVAASNRLQITARVLDGDEAAAAALCRRIDVEIALIATLLVVTAVLTSYTSPD